LGRGGLGAGRAGCCASGGRSHAACALLIRARIGDNVDGANLQRAVSRLRARDLYLMCIIRFERIVIAAYVDGLSVVRCQRPIATSLLQATAHGGLLAIAA
jgi:hypothetical protein